MKKIFKLICNQLKNRINSIPLLRGIEELRSFNNPDINRHINNTNIKSLVSKRGEMFSNAIKANSLCDYEALLISGYADFIASKLNAELRKPLEEKGGKEWVIYEKLLNKGLRKVAPKSNATVYVMYQCDDKREEDKLYSWYEKRIGESAQFPNFLSSSQYPWPNRQPYLQIKTLSKTSGKFIAPLTGKNQKGGEEEVLFMSNTTFRIEGVQRDKRTILLSELPRKVKGKYLLQECYLLNYRDKGEPEEEEENDEGYFEIDI